MYDDVQTLLLEIAAGEDTFLELKEAVFRGNRILIGDAGRAAHEIAEVFCSIANTEGGVVVFGVRKDGAIVGVPRDKKDLLEQFRGQYRIEQLPTACRAGFGLAAYSR